MFSPPPFDFDYFSRLFMFQNENEDENQSFRSFWRYERTDPSMYHITRGLVCLSQALSRMNENFRLRVRFRFRPGTRIAYK